MEMLQQHYATLQYITVSVILQHLQQIEFVVVVNANLTLNANSNNYYEHCNNSKLASASLIVSSKIMSSIPKVLLASRKLLKIIHIYANAKSLPHAFHFETI